MNDNTQETEKPMRVIMPLTADSGCYRTLNQAAHPIAPSFGTCIEHTDASTVLEWGDFEIDDDTDMCFGHDLYTESLVD